MDGAELRGLRRCGSGGGGGSRVNVGLDVKYWIDNNDNDGSPGDNGGPFVQRDIDKSST